MHYTIYLILAHKKPDQIAKLISTLSHENTYFFLHIDQKINVKIFDDLKKVRTCIFIKKRVKCDWGSFGLVQATLNSMVEIEAFMNLKYQKINYHLIQISGEDLPLKSNNFIQNYLASKPETSFINHWLLPNKKWWNGGMFRFESIYLIPYNRYPKTHFWLNKIVKNSFLKRYIAINQIGQNIPNLKLFGALQWMILSKKMVAFVINNANDKKFNRIFKYVLAPDEIYFPTLIYHFDKEKIFQIENIPTHLVIFEGNKPNPEYLKIQDLEKHKDNNDYLFARKFDPTKNPEATAYILDHIKS